MFDKVSPGSEGGTTIYSARWVNAVSDAARYYHQEVAGGASKSRAGIKFPTDLVLVENVTEGDLPQGSVVQLGNHLLTEVDSRNPIYEGDVPADPAYLAWAILLQPLPEDEFGPAQMSGVCLALVDVIDVGHSHANAVAGETVLESGISGPIEILTLPDETGEQLLLCRLSVAPPSGTGEAEESIANGAAGDIEPDLGTLTSPTGSGLSEEMVNIGPAVETGDPVTWSWIRGQLAFVKLCS